MTNITKQQYEFALERIEELLPLVSDETPADDKKSIELSVMSEIVMEYEREYYPIEKPAVGELIALALEDMGITKKELAAKIGVSPSRISDFVSGRAKPTLDIAKSLCLNLNISPSEILGI